MRSRSLAPWVVAVAALLSGCASSPVAPGPSAPRATIWPPEGGSVADVAPGGTHCAASACTVREGSARGVRLDARLSQSGHVHTIDATATNDGDRTYWLSSACIFDPWVDMMFDHRGLQLRASKPAPPTWSSDDCNACDVQEFGPGATLPMHAVFNETFWHPDGYPVQARSGTYQWEVGIFLWFDEHCDRDLAGTGVAVNFDVTVP